MTSFKGKRVSQKRLSGVTITGIVVDEDKRFLYVKRDKQPTARDYDFTIPIAQLKDMPELFTFEDVQNERE